MAAIPQNVILVWAGTNASIPSGYVRETTLDSKFAKGWGVENPNTTGGNPTHTHTSSAHKHTLASHTHTYTIPRITPFRDGSNIENPGEAIGQDHIHTGTTGSESFSETGTTAVTYGAVSNNPPYYDVIFIKASGGSLLTTNIIALWAGWQGNNSVPMNWQICDGTGGSPDLRNKYLRGAGTGADAGTTGGSLTNVHDITHTHTGAGHTQGASTSSEPTPSSHNSISTGGSNCCSVLNHTHSVNSTNSTTVTPDTYSGTLTTLETVEPVYKKTCAIQNTATGIKASGIIGMWLGTAASIPTGWVLCDGTNGTPNLKDFYIKIANDTAEIGATGGANAHTHAAQNHLHTTSGHTHTVTQTINHVGFSRKNLTSGGGNRDDVIDTDTHGAITTDSVAPNFLDTSTTADSSANEPEYRTAVYIQFQQESLMAGML